MNREIKFRIWNKIAKKFEQHALGMGTDGQLITNHNEDFELNQYTGLKDKDWMDIYEGDILKYIKTNGRKHQGTVEVHHYEVYFDRGQWRMRRGDVEQALFDKATRHEVIGNIYENPDLLQANSKEA